MKWRVILGQQIKFQSVENNDLVTVQDTDLDLDQVLDLDIDQYKNGRTLQLENWERRLA